MPIPSSLGVTPGTGSNIAATSYTDENAHTVLDQKVILGEQYLSTFDANAIGINASTSASHILQIMAGSSLDVRIRRITVWQSAVATTAAISDLAILRLTSAGTGGTVVTPTTLVPSDTTTSSARTLPSSKGSEGAIIMQPTLTYTQTVPVSGPGNAMLLFDYDWDALRAKPLIIGAGTSNGLALKIITGVAGATLNVTVTYSESVF